MVLDSYPFDCVQHMEDIACDVALRVEDRDIEVTCYVAPDVPESLGRSSKAATDHPEPGL